MIKYKSSPNWGVISSIKLNGNTLTINDDGSVNITINKSTVGLGNVDNTSDINKPVSSAMQTALNKKLNSTPALANDSTYGFNIYQGTGFYYIQNAAALQYSPTSAAVSGILIVVGYNDYSSNIYYRGQLLIGQYNGTSYAYFRGCNGNNWTPWKAIQHVS